AVGLWSHSLALLADSEHMISDSLALGLALLATWLARSARTDAGVQGNHRVEVGAALINGVGLVAIALWIAREAVMRLQAPAIEILSLPMLMTAIVGLGVNSVNILLLHQDSHHDLNLKGAFLHIVADAISSIGVILAAISVWQWHWLWADGVISLFVAGLIILGAIPLILQSGRMLLTTSVTEVS
ncbi:MAG: cation diffusion facilitator family transporter, partial [Leptolyngbyaceae bacterium]|nr:cation diffusion facilitator family transporter [Leptolyngbyaceae bacterium]